MSECCSKGNTCGCSSDVRKVSTKPTVTDMFGAWKTRWGVGRMDYKIEPGLYAIGNPNEQSPALVSCNYKLTFDTLRKELDGMDCWLMILDTNGVNVWCAAGKGTFGTEELIYRIKDSGLSAVISHKRLILPQLGASGVNSNEVTRKTGFHIIYGPVRASDIKPFIANNHTATDDMRTVRFTAWDRLKLTPIEMVTAARHAIVVFGIMFVINLFAQNPFGFADFIAYVVAALAGTFVTPVLLPFIPVRMFAIKGYIWGLLGVALVAVAFNWFSNANAPLLIGYSLILPSASVWYAINFTGSSTYTSPSGVQKEMRLMLPIMVIAAAVGSVMVLISRVLA